MSAARSYLVTGGTGFLGSALVRRLLTDGHRVRVIDNDWRGRASRLADLADACEMVEADVRDTDAVARAVRGVDCVCHLAFINGTRHFYQQPELVLDVAVRGMLAVLDGCRTHDVRDLLVMSSSEVYQTPPVIPTDESVPLSIPDPLNPRYSYAGGKLISELMALNYGRRNFERVTVVRPHNVYGPDMGWEHVIPQFVVRMRELMDRYQGLLPFPIQGTGDETRAFVFVDDFIDGVLCVLERGLHRGIYHVGTEEEVSIRTVADTTAAFFGRAIEIVPGTPAPGGTARRCPDISRVRGLGYAPRVRFTEGLPVVARWYDEHFSERPISDAGDTCPSP